MDWIYNNKLITNITQLPDNSYGFVYIITNTITDRKYIGKKNLYSKRNILLSAKELTDLRIKQPKGRLPKKKLVIKESNWLKYYGSSDDLKQDIKKEGKPNFKREILQVVYTKRDLTYYETKYLFLHSVIESNDYYNKNILNKFFK